MGIVNDLWQKKESPLWLLYASRYIASDHNKRPDLSLNNEYLDQFAYGNLPEIDDPHFFDKIHSRHVRLFAIFGREALAYSDVFYELGPSEYDAYTDELVGQYNKAYGPDKHIDFPNYEFNQKRHIFANLMVAVAIAAVRDMAIVEDLNRQGKLTSEEYSFGLKEINSRMDRVGINGIDKLFESKPELEEFIQHDIREIDVSHVAWKHRKEINTRAAFYNVQKHKFEKFKIQGDSLTYVRQQIISPKFTDLEEDKDHYLLVNVHEAPELSDEVRKKYAGYGILTGRGSQANDLKHAKLFKKFVGSNDHSAYADYVNFLVHDGIAINHPERDNYINKIRQEMKDAGSPKVTILKPNERIDAEDVVSSFEDVAPSQGEQENESSLLPVLTDKDAASVPKKNNNDIEDAVILEETATPIDPNKKNEVTVVKAEPDDAPTGDHEKDDHSSHEYDKSKNVAKIVTLGGAATLAGLLLSKNSDSRAENGSLNSDHKKEHHKSNLKPLVFAAAATVTIGAAVMWSKKPQAIYKPLKELVDKLIGGLGRA